MAGDWIKMRTNLDTDPRVSTISESLGIPELYVVGCLWKLWSWANEHTLDGNAVSVTKVTLERYLGVTGFCAELKKVGWLEEKDGKITFPRFDEHNGQTAKKRALTAKRVALFKQKNGNAEVTPSALPREEKRREENKEKKNEELGKLDLLEDPTFATTWRLWQRHRIEKHKPLGDVESEQQLFELARHHPHEAAEIVAFSIRAGAVNLILNGDHRKPVKPVEQNTKKQIVTLENLR